MSDECRLAEPARTDCRGEGGSVLVLHSRGLRRRLLCRRHGTGQFLAADPDGGDRDEQGEQRDPRGNKEATRKADRQGVVIDGRRWGYARRRNGWPAFAAAAAAFAT
jgi:hypothetical protein